LRQARNSIAHTVNRRLSPAATDVVQDILTVFRLLFADRSWFTARRDYLERSPLAQLDSGEHCAPQLISEFETIFKTLGAQSAVDCLGLSAEPDVVCPVCAQESDYLELRPRSALLSTEGNVVSCAICGGDTAVEAAACERCSNGLGSPEYGLCVRCGGWVG